MTSPQRSKDPRTEVVGVRLTPAEKQELEARAAGIPLSTFLRTAGLRRSLPQPIPLINLQTYQTLSRIANGLSNLESQKDESTLAMLRDIKADMERIGAAVLAITPETRIDEDFYEDEYNL